MTREQCDIFLVAVIAIAGIARALLECCRLHILQQPIVCIEIVALDLVGGSRDTPAKILWELPCGDRGGTERRRHCARRR